MRVSRVVAGLAAIISTVAGLSVVTSGPAAAADSGNWRAYGNTNPITSSTSTWTCGPTSPVELDAVAQACVVRAPSGTPQQVAIIVRNNASYTLTAAATATLFWDVGEIVYGTWICDSSGIAAHSWSVCFGPSHNYADSGLRADGEVNGSTVYDSN